MSGLDAFYFETGKRIQSLLRREIKVMPDEPIFCQNAIFVNSVSGAKTLSLNHGTIDRGPRMDLDYLSRLELEDIQREYIEKHEHLIDKVKDLIEKELSPLSCDVRVDLDYGEKGHLVLGVNLLIKGRFYKDKDGKDLWAAFDGIYDPYSIMLMTPDIERYFDSPEEAEKFAKNFSYKDDSEIPF